MAWNSSARKIDIKANINGIEHTSNSITYINIYDAMCSEQALKVGGVFSAKCEIKLKPKELIPKNAQVIPYCKEGEQVFIPLGVFNIDNRVEEGDMLNLTCYDALYSAGRQYLPTISFPATKMQVFNDICTQLGIEKYNNIILSEDIINEAPRYESTMRDVLSDIAKSAGACIHMSRDNKIQFLYFPTISSHTIYKKDYSDLQILNDVRTYDNVIINFDTDQEIVSGIKNLRTAMILDLPWATKAIADKIRTSLTGLNYTPCRITWRGYPNLEIGSRVSIEKKDGTFIETILLENQYSFTGGLLQTSTAPSDTEQESEFGGFSIKREVIRHGDDLGKIDSVLDIEDNYTGLEYTPIEGLPGQITDLIIDDNGFKVEGFYDVDLPKSIIESNKDGFKAVGFNEDGIPSSSIESGKDGFKAESNDANGNSLSSIENNEKGLTIRGNSLNDNGITKDTFETHIGKNGITCTREDSVSGEVETYTFPQIFISESNPSDSIGNDGDLWLIISKPTGAV